MPTLFTVAGFPFVTMLIERYPSTGPGDKYCNVFLPLIRQKYG